MNRYLYIFLFTLLTACSGPDSKQEIPTLTVTLEPLRYFTEAIAGDKFQVVSMVPKGSNPETYDPTPQQLVRLNQSQAYFRIGYIGFEQAWMERLEANAPQLKIVDTSRKVHLIKGKGHYHGDHYHEGGVEPHIWNSAQNAMVITRNIYTALCELDANNQAYYKQRLDSIQQVIKQTDQTIKETLQHADSTFLIYHPALSYFARDYGLTQISIEEDGKEPSPAQLSKLIEQCREKQAKTIFVQQEFDTRNAQLIADELGIPVTPINPLNYNWTEEMLHIASSLKK